MNLDDFRKVVVTSVSKTYEKNVMIFHKWIMIGDRLVGLVEDHEGNMSTYPYSNVKFLPISGLHWPIKVWDEMLQEKGYNDMLAHYTCNPPGDE